MYRYMYIYIYIYINDLVGAKQRGINIRGDFLDFLKNSFQFPGVLATERVIFDRMSLYFLLIFIVIYNK